MAEAAIVNVVAASGYGMVLMRVAVLVAEAAITQAVASTSASVAA
jgi:hypothetical protein